MQERGEKEGTSQAIQVMPWVCPSSPSFGTEGMRQPGLSKMPQSDLQEMFRKIRLGLLLLGVLDVHALPSRAPSQVQVLQGDAGQPQEPSEAEYGESAQGWPSYGGHQANEQA